MACGERSLLCCSCAFGGACLPPLLQRQAVHGCMHGCMNGCLPDTLLPGTHVHAAVWLL